MGLLRRDVASRQRRITAAAKLKTLSGDHEIYIYANAGYAFANEGGDRYKKQAADLAWTRTVDFLKKNL